MRLLPLWLHECWTRLQSVLTPLNVIGALVLVCLLAVVYNSYVSYDVANKLDREVKRNAQVTRDNNEALCSLRAERLHDVEDTEQFLEDHPEQIIRLGSVVLSRAQIVDDLKDARETVRATDHLQCPEE